MKSCMIYYIHSACFLYVHKLVNYTMTPLEENKLM